jgi:hypothetical protein
MESGKTQNHDELLKIMQMFETITITQPWRYGQWREMAASLKTKLWGLQLLYGGNWSKDSS